MLAIRIICAPHEVPAALDAVNRTFRLKRVRQIPTRDGDRQRLYIDAEPLTSPARATAQRLDRPPALDGT